MMMRRRRSSGAFPPPLRRCSTASVASLSSSTGSISDSIQAIDQITNEDNIHGSYEYSFLHRIRRFFCFDALDLQSTGMRNAKMISTLDEGSFTRISHYGVDVCFTEEYHLPGVTLERYRQIGDPEMDRLLTKLNVGPFDDVISAAATAAASNDPTISETTQELAQFYKHYEQVPSWVDFDQIQRGINVFLAYLPAAGCALYYRSLVGGFSIPKIVEVLKSTRYLMSDRKKTLERLIDTGGLLAACFAPTIGGHIPAESLRPGGKGWIAALQVRVLHAKVRRRLLQRKGMTSSQAWDTDKNGIPINQEDLAATLLAFSVNVLVGIEIIAGKPLAVSEQLDYLALWRYIGWLLGIDTPESEDVSSNGSEDSLDSFPIDPCAPSMLHSYASLESILVHILHPEPSSCDLVTHLLSVTGSITFRAEVCRKLIGNPLADALGLQNCSCWKGWRADAIQTFVLSFFVKVAVLIYFMIFRFYTLLTMNCPWFKKKATCWHGELERKFLQKWEEGHPQRMRAASKIGSATSANASDATSSFCPFSMVMPPQVR